MVYKNIRISLDSNPMKLTLLNQIKLVSKKLCSALPQKTVEDPFALYHQRKRINTKLTKLKYESNVQFCSMKQREINMEKVKGEQAEMKGKLEEYSHKNEIKLKRFDQELEELNYQFKFKKSLNEKQLVDIQAQIQLLQTINKRIQSEVYQEKLMLSQVQNKNWEVLEKLHVSCLELSSICHC